MLNIFFSTHRRGTSFHYLICDHWGLGSFYESFWPRCYRQGPTLLRTVRQISMIDTTRHEKIDVERSNIIIVNQVAKSILHIVLLVPGRGSDSEHMWENTEALAEWQLITYANGEESPRFLNVNSVTFWLRLVFTVSEWTLEPRWWRWLHVKLPLAPPSYCRCMHACMNILWLYVVVERQQ
jgi:hypothetical protein